MNASLHLWLIPLAPLVGFVLNGLLGSRLPAGSPPPSACLRRCFPLA